MLYSKEILNLAGITLKQIKEEGEKRKEIAIQIFKNRIAKIKTEIGILEEDNINKSETLQNYLSLCQTGTALQLRIILEGISFRLKNLVEERNLYSDALEYLQTGE